MERKRNLRPVAAALGIGLMLAWGGAPTEAARLKNKETPAQMELRRRALEKAERAKREYGKTFRTAEEFESASLAAGRTEGRTAVPSEVCATFAERIVSKLRGNRAIDGLKIGGVRPVRSGGTRTWRSAKGELSYDANAERLVLFETRAPDFPAPMGLTIGSDSEAAWSLLASPKRQQFPGGWSVGSGPTLIVLHDDDFVVKAIRWQTGPFPPPTLGGGGTGRPKKGKVVISETFSAEADR